MFFQEKEFKDKCLFNDWAATGSCNETWKRGLQHSYVAKQYKNLKMSFQFLITQKYAKVI